MANCGCNTNGFSNSDILLQNGIRICQEGLLCCRQGLEEVIRNNFRNGVSDINTGLCQCRRGLALIERALQNSNGRNREACRGLRECREALREISCGCSEIRNSNVQDGIEDIDAGIIACEEGLNRIEGGVEQNNCLCNRS